MALIARGADTHRRAHTNRIPGQKHARSRVKYTTINTAHNSTYLIEWINPLCHCPPSTVLNNTQLTTWRFLIKAPYLGNLSVTYDAENKGLSYFPSDENKGLKSIAEIRCSVIKSLITDSMASIRLVT